ncbi:Uncharacterized protein Rs2_45283 [Raphanus sativus]|nr:Uncharacterized protein Rs2_45283 [Raphanus sativus]
MACVFLGMDLLPIYSKLLGLANTNTHLLDIIGERTAVKVQLVTFSSYRNDPRVVGGTYILDRLMHGRTLTVGRSSSGLTSKMWINSNYQGRQEGTSGLSEDNEITWMQYFLHNVYASMWFSFF